jgi:hypothetical protein
MNTVITRNHLDKSLTYSQFLKLTEKLLAENKTTGANQSENYVEYTKLNFQRMQRIEKTVQLQPQLIDSLQNLSTTLYWVVLAEAWCGDVAQNLPIIAKMVDASPSIELCILLRDENPEIMDAYLTNGAKSIPQLICLKQTDLSETGQWGPRPKTVQEMVMEHKKDPKESYSEFTKIVQMWYTKDKSITLQNEFMALLKSWQRA